MKFIKNYWLNFIVFGVLLGCLGWSWHISQVRADGLQGSKEELKESIDKIVVGEKIKNTDEIKHRGRWYYVLDFIFRDK